MEGSEPQKGTVVATIRQLKAREEAQRLETQNKLRAVHSRSDSPLAEGRPETSMETLLALQSFVPKENLASYLHFVSYMGKRAEDDVFVRLVQFLAIHTKLGQQVPGEVHKAGQEIIREIHQSMSNDVSSWKEEHDSLNRIKHEFQGSISSMLKEHGEAHKKYIGLLMQTVVKTVAQLEENQRILSEEFHSVMAPSPGMTSRVNIPAKGSTNSSWGKLPFYLAIISTGFILGGLSCLIVLFGH